MVDPDLTVQQHDSTALAEVLAQTARLAVSARVDLIGANAAVFRYVHRGPAATVVSIDSALTGALAVGDATITASIDAVAVAGGVITITQAGSAAGDLDQAIPTALNVLADGAVLELTVGGTNTAAVFADVSVELTYVAEGSA